MIDIEDLRGWIDRVDTQVDEAMPGPLARLAALLDHRSPPWQPDALPPLGHWLYFLPCPRESELDRDGHQRRGDFLPPVALPRRMWAASVITFHTPLPIGATIERYSRIVDISYKHGKSGDLVFVTVSHDIAVRGTLCVSERQNIVYRGPHEATSIASDRASPARTCASTRRIVTGAPLLFRFSALTYNAHRIHYDHVYAAEEGYTGLVVHGPLIAILLMDLALRGHPGRSVQSFNFRSVRPLIGEAPCDLCGAEIRNGMELWARDEAGHETTTARLTWA
jgi:3-methylfumaryl-CoA hydratase